MKALDQAGLPAIRFHDLRHTFANAMLGANVPEKVVSAVLGHSGIQVTMDTYSHVNTAMQEKAVETMDKILAFILANRHFEPKNPSKPQKLVSSKTQLLGLKRIDLTPVSLRIPGFSMAEKEGFEPSIPFWGIHDFQSCALGQLRDFSMRCRLATDLHIIHEVSRNVKHFFPFFGHFFVPEFGLFTKGYSYVTIRAHICEKSSARW